MDEYERSPDARFPGRSKSRGKCLAKALTRQSGGLSAAKIQIQHNHSLPSRIRQLYSSLDSTIKHRMKGDFRAGRLMRVTALLASLYPGRRREPSRAGQPGRWRRVPIPTGHGNRRSHAPGGHADPAPWRCPAGSAVLSLVLDIASGTAAGNRACSLTARCARRAAPGGRAGAARGRSGPRGPWSPRFAQRVRPSRAGAVAGPGRTPGRAVRAGRPASARTGTGQVPAPRRTGRDRPDSVRRSTAARL